MLRLYTHVLLADIAQAGFEVVVLLPTNSVAVIGKGDGREIERLEGLPMQVGSRGQSMHDGPDRSLHGEQLKRPEILLAGHGAPTQVPLHFEDPNLWGKELLVSQDIPDDVEMAPQGLGEAVPGADEARVKSTADIGIEPGRELGRVLLYLERLEDTVKILEELLECGLFRGRFG